MTTVLAHFYARAAAVLAAVFAFLFLFAALAFAQDAQVIPTDTGDGWAAFFANASAAGQATIFAILSGLFAWLSPKLPAWLKSTIDMVESRDSAHWEEYVRKLAETSFAAAGGSMAHKLDTLEGKAGALGGMLKFVRMYGADLYSYLDRDDNKVLDVLEAQLRRIAPNLAVSPEGGPPSMPQALMSEPPRAPRRAPTAMSPILPTSRRKASTGAAMQ